MKNWNKQKRKLANSISTSPLYANPSPRSGTSSCPKCSRRPCLNNSSSRYCICVMSCWSLRGMKCRPLDSARPIVLVSIWTCLMYRRNNCQKYRRSSYSPHNAVYPISTSTRAKIVVDNWKEKLFNSWVLNMILWHYDIIIIVSKTYFNV